MDSCQIHTEGMCSCMSELYRMAPLFTKTSQDVRGRMVYIL